MDIITSHNPTFDLSESLRQTIIQQSQKEEELDVSPLTSLASSPATTPPPSPDPRLQLPWPPSLLPDPPPLLPDPPSLLPDPPSLLPDPPTVAQSSSNRNRKEKRKAAHTNARKKRRKEEADASFGLYKVRKRVLDRYVEDGPSIPTSFNAEESKVDSKGFVALRGQRRPKKVYRLEELVGEESKMKFRLIEWNGQKPALITDSSKRVIAVLAGFPPGDDWPAMHQEAAQALEDRRARCLPPNDKKKRKNRRGPFMALQCGVSHGGGQIAPKNLANLPENAAVLEELNNLRPFKRIAGFASSVLACRAPLLYGHYARILGQLFERDKSLKKIFPSTIFPAASYNFGPQTVCYPHLDPGNYAPGQCAVTSVGTYDYTKGGHLVLWECHLVIQFPPGSTILLPSAIVTHSNTAIGPEETRYSFALYSAGALFRWVENGFQRSSDYYNSLSEEERKSTEVANAARWKFGLSLLPVVQNAVVETEPVVEEHVVEDGGL